MTPVPALEANGWLPPGHHEATWAEVIAHFRDGEGSHRAHLTDRLLSWKDALVAAGVQGLVLLNGSYVSGKENPSDFDIALMAQPDIQALKDMNPTLRELLDSEHCERELGFSVFFFPNNSPMLDLLRSMWDQAKDGTPKGVLEVSL
jgi:hypothetical protein